MFKKIAKVVGLLVLVVLVGGGAFVGFQVMSFNKSMAKVYDIKPLDHIKASTDAAVIERGKHLATSLAGCALRDCHGEDLSGGKVMEVGPLGKFAPQNITPGGVAANYSDGELARLIVHGVRKDGTSLRFMPVEDFNWLPDEDITAIVSYVRSVPKVDKPSGQSEVGLLAKILDRMGKFKMDVARNVDHDKRGSAPTPAPTAAYGAYIARLCTGCHGEGLSGGPIPGAPPSMAVPRNLTAHETGMKDYSYEEFLKVIETGTMKNGKKLDPIMPIEALAKMNDVERQALWAHLRAVPPKPFGQR